MTHNAYQSERWRYTDIYSLFAYRRLNSCENICFWIIMEMIIKQL